MCLRWLLACIMLLYAGSAQAQLPSVNSGGVVNGASFTAGAAVASGSIISIFGTNLATGTMTAGSIPLPTNLGGTSVQINGLLAPLFYVSPNQINAQLPFETATGSASVVVTVGSSSSGPVTVNVTSSAPGIFLEPGNRSASINADNTVNAANNPAASGSVLVTYMTGQGPVDNPVATGTAASSNPLSNATAPASATIGGQNAQIMFLGLAPGYVGLLQANIRLPNLSYGDYLMTITIGGVASNSALVTVSSTGVAFKHVVVIVQENRTPDNLFQGLCTAPYGSAQSCTTTATGSKYDILTQHWLNKKSATGITEPTVIPLANSYDLSHAHSAFVAMCDANAMTGACSMDGAAGIACSGTCPSDPQFRYVDNSTGILNPYLQLATQYGWANLMFQTNQGPSFPAHQFLFGGTSAPSTADDAAGVFASENTAGASTDAGCTAPFGTTVAVINSAGVENSRIYPCFEHSTVADILPSVITWRYYAPSAGSIWTAPNAISHICQSTGPGGQCVGQDWSNNVDLKPADVLSDIMKCNLRSVSWVIPTGANSDHAQSNDGGGPSWVASIVNAIGNSTTCDNNTGYWNNTAIFITWDDWGGWYDHEPPTILAKPEGDYQYGFRVPLLVVSAYTPQGYINNTRHDFGSLLRFIEHNFGIQEGTLNFADARATSDLTGFFNLDQAPRAFQTVAAPQGAAFFLNDTRPPTDPDDD